VAVAVVAAAVTAVGPAVGAGAADGRAAHAGAGSGRSDVAASGQWTTTLPETNGVSVLTADADAAFVAWADMPSGHSAAFSPTSGRLVWHATTAEFADLAAADDGTLWTSDGGTLVAQRAATGHRFASVASPAHEGFVTVAAAGGDLDALSNGRGGQILSVYGTSGRLVARHVTGVPSTSFCQEVTGGSDLYALCIGGSEQWTIYRVDATTGRVAATRRLPPGTDGGQSLVYADGNVYVLEATGPGGSNTIPASIARLDATTLALSATSASLPIIAIAGAGSDPVGLEITAKDVPTAVDVFAPTTLDRTARHAVHSTDVEVAFAADATTAFTVVAKVAKTQTPEQLVGVNLRG
jgi:hypothetical protein